MDKNVVVGKPLVELYHLYGLDETLCEVIDLFTEERFLPKILVEIGFFKSNGEVRRNRPDLVRELNRLEFTHIKVGKKHLWLTVGE